MWFTENPWPPMLIAALGALACLALWNSARRKPYLYLALLLLGLTGGIYVAERAIVTEGERLQDEVAVICHQFRNRDPAILTHFSETAPGLKVLCKTAMEMVKVRDDFRLTDFSTTFTNQGSRANVHFRANAELAVMDFSGRHPFRCILTFGKEAGAWKILEVQRLNPINGDKMGALDH
jgi:hypothetical protein